MSDRDYVTLARPFPLIQLSPPPPSPFDLLSAVVLSPSGRVVCVLSPVSHVPPLSPRLVANVAAGAAIGVAGFALGIGMVAFAEAQVRVDRPYILDRRGGGGRSLLLLLFLSSPVLMVRVGHIFCFRCRLYHSLSLSRLGTSTIVRRCVFCHDPVAAPPGNE